MSAREPVVRVRDLAVDGLLAAVSFDLGAGDCLAIVDEHDLRRTALLRCIGGAQAPDAGEVQAPIAACVWHEDGMPEHDPVGRTIADRLETTDDEVQTLLDALGLGHRATHEPWAMSAGERRRIAVEIALSSGRDLVVLDEPERGLDKNGLRWLASRIRATAAAGTTIVLATYSQQLAEECADIVVDEL